MSLKQIKAVHSLLFLPGKVEKRRSAYFLLIEGEEPWWLGQNIGEVLDGLHGAARALQRERYLQMGWDRYGLWDDPQPDPLEEWRIWAETPTKGS